MTQVRLSVKTFAVSLLLGLSLVGAPFAMAQQSDPLAAIEKNLFTRDYPSDALESRLGRIETVIFGQAQPGTPQTRQQQIEAVFEKNTFKSAHPDLKRDEIPPSREIRELDGLPETRDGTDYPLVSQMETRLYKQHFAHEPIQKRLSRLEQQVFQQNFSHLPLVDRVDQLTLKVLPENPLSLEERNSTLPSKAQDFIPSNLAIYDQLNALEERLIGRTYGGELIINRLARLEKKLFGAAQPGSIDERMGKLMANYASQRPVVQQSPTVGPAQSYVPGYPPQAASPAPAVIGTELLGGQPFSREMMSMLPAQVQHQLGVQGTGSVSGIGAPVYQNSQTTTVYQGPGTWTTQTEILVPSAPNSIIIPPGQVYRPNFGYPYGPQAVAPRRDPMQFPGGALGPMFQNNNMGTVPFGAANTISQPFAPALSMLESQIFGRTYEGTYIASRLNNLELHVFGRAYPQLPFQQRINRLMSRSVYRQS